MSIPNLTLLLVAISIIGCLFICYLGYRKTNQNSLDDFYLAGRDLGSLVLFLTVGASWFSMWFLFGAPASFFKHGLGFSEFFILNIVLACMMYVVGRRIWVLGKIYGYVTPGDLLSHYYGSNFIRMLSSVVGIYLLFPYIGIQLIGAGVAFQAIGSSFWTGVIAMLVIVTVYSMVGGLKAVAWTDAVQGMFFMLLTWGCAFWLLGNNVTGIGSLTNLFTEIRQNSPDFLLFPGPSKYFTPINWFGYIAIYATAGMCLPHLWTRYYMAKDISVFKKVPIGHIFFASWGFVPILIIAMIGKLHMPEIENPDQIFPALLHQYAPVMSAVLVTAAFAAAMSTVDSQMMTLGTLFTKDVWKSFIEPNASERKEVWIGRVATLVLMAVSTIWAFSAKGTIIALSMISFTSASLLFLPLIGALFYPRAGKYSASISLLVGFVILLFTTYVFKNPFGVYGGIYALAGEALVFFGLSIWERHDQNPRVLKYHNLLRAALGGKIDTATGIQ